MMDDETINSKFYKLESRIVSLDTEIILLKKRLKRHAYLKDAHTEPIGG